MSARPLPKPGSVDGTTSTHDAQDWRHRAACLTEDPELFYPDSRGVGEALQTAAAKAVCARRPVQPACLQDALAEPSTWGVWGGELFAGGAIVTDKPRRPHRKAAA